MSILFFISLLLLLISISSAKLNKYYVLIKSITSILFCCIGLINFSHSGVTNWLLLMLPILLCMVGDVSLGYYQCYGKSINFRVGLISFLIAHTLFVYHLQTINSLRTLEIILSLFGVVFTYLMDKLKLISFGKQKIYSITYSFFVTLLLVKGLFIAISLQTTIGYMYGLASLLFFISDFILMFMYFRKSNTLLHVLNLSTYYLAMFLFVQLLYR